MTEADKAEVTTTSFRKYALTKIAKGDYLLLSNDGKTLWRIHRYTDGPSYGLDPAVFPHDFSRWGLMRYVKPFTSHATVNTDDWDLFPTVEDDFPTRTAAVTKALQWHLER